MLIYYQEDYRSIPFTREQLDGFKKAYLSGESMQSIAIKAGVSENVIKRRLLEMDVKIRPFGKKSMPADQVKAAVAMINSGISVAVAARANNLIPSSLRRKLHRERVVEIVSMQ